jgi:hypothetical protein
MSVDQASQVAYGLFWLDEKYIFSIIDRLQVANVRTCYYGFSYKLDNYEMRLKLYSFKAFLFKTWD